MARILVKSSDSHATPVPFLRGILTRSLQDSGLSFEDSYRVASQVREDLGENAEISTDELRKRVKTLLTPYGPEAVQRYERPSPAAPPIQIRYPDGTSSAFSRGQHRLRLEAAGIASEVATQLAARIHDHLSDRGVEQIAFDQLRELTRGHVSESLGDILARRFQVMEGFRETRRPLVILVGGIAGVGKSTLANEVAHVLEVLRTLPTDMLRELMRMLIPPRLLPVLHTSSFRAWTELPDLDHPVANHEELLVRGFLSQAEPVSLACEAVIQRALRERVHVIIEGIHLAPSLLPKLPASSDALVVPILLAVLRPAELRKRLLGRGSAVPGRRARRYLDHFDDLWRLQSFLLSEADRAGIPIVTNDDKDRTLQHVLARVVDAIERDNARRETTSSATTSGETPSGGPPS